MGSDSCIITAPHQPSNFKFPKRSFGVKKVEYRCFQPKWFVKWLFLYYIEAKDVVFYHPYMEPLKLKRISVKNPEPVFVSVFKLSNAVY